MAEQYESLIGAICGSTTGNRAVQLQQVLNGERAFVKQCHMRGPQARLLHLAGIKVELTTHQHASEESARKAEFSSAVKKNEVWEEIMALMSARERAVGECPLSLKYILRLFAIKGDIYTRSYMNRMITEQEDRDYMNKFFDLTGREAL